MPIALRLLGFQNFYFVGDLDHISQGGVDRAIFFFAELNGFLCFFKLDAFADDLIAQVDFRNFQGGVSSCCASAVILSWCSS